MRLISNGFVAAAAVAFSAAAAAQTTTTTQPTTTTTNQPMQPTPMTSQTTAPGQTQTTPGAASQTAPGQTGTTPGQMQTTPGDASQMTPSTTGETPSGQTTGQAEKDTALTPVTASDVKAGATVYDQSGAKIGKVQSIDSKGVVVNTGKARAVIPLASFARGEQGLVIGTTKAEIEAAKKPAKKH